MKHFRAVIGGFTAVATTFYSLPAFAAGTEMPPLVYDIGISIFIASILAIVFVRLKIPSIAAFLLCGILIGPIGLKLITHPENIETISELGFILLLFMIGMEIDLRRMLKSGRMIIVTGFLQYPISVVFGILLVKIFAWIGVFTSLDGPYDALYFGIFIAASSTLLVIKLFQENYELDTEPGRIALGILVFQDFWAIVVIVMQPSFANPELIPVLMSCLGIVILSVVSYCLAKSLVPIVFKWLAKEPQLILVGAIGWCFTIVFIGGSLDYVGSMIFGAQSVMAVATGMSALIAGMTIATLAYSREIVAKVGIVRDFFITLFFVGLGMSIPPISGIEVILLALALAFFALLSRQLIFFPLLYFTGGDQRHAQVASIRLAQLSEFGLVIAYLGSQYGHISDEFASAVIFGFILTALLTPTLYKYAYDIHRKIAPVLQAIGFREPNDEAISGEKEFDLVLLGFHRVASSLLHEIAVHKPELVSRILVIDFNVQLHAAIRKMGASVRYGDLSNDETLQHAGIDKAKVIVATIPDDILRGTSNKKLVQTVRNMNPEAVVIANSEEPSTAKDVYASGADYVYMGRINTARALEEIITRTMEGSLSDYRREQEELHGPHHERTEILK
ncbi:MAG: cation:proton antiporter [Proteobacteria bacterium]|nr:cation:proton antiporter [Pseudomonadota bacterium]